MCSWATKSQNMAEKGTRFSTSQWENPINLAFYASFHHDSSDFTKIWNKYSPAYGKVKTTMRITVAVQWSRRQMNIRNISTFQHTEHFNIATWEHTTWMWAYKWWFQRFFWRNLDFELKFYLWVYFKFYRYCRVIIDDNLIYFCN